jgi:hypothetical protein
MSTDLRSLSKRAATVRGVAVFVHEIGGGATTSYDRPMALI